jgi:hypothetical protein
MLFSRHIDSKDSHFLTKLFWSMNTTNIYMHYYITHVFNTGTYVTLFRHVYTPYLVNIYICSGAWDMKNWKPEKGPLNQEIY